MPYILSRCSSVERWSLQLPELQLYQLGMPELEVLELELAELEWRLAGGTLSADEEEAIRRRLAAIEHERQHATCSGADRLASADLCTGLLPLVLRGVSTREHGQYLAVANEEYDGSHWFARRRRTILLACF
jgi:hypothetical protein